MTKSIASYPTHERRAVIERRLKTNTGGMGYWAAKAAAEKLGIVTPNSGPFNKRDPKPRRTNEEREARRVRRKPTTGHKPFKQAFAS